MTIANFEGAIDAVDSLEEIFPKPTPPPSSKKLQLSTTPSKATTDVKKPFRMPPMSPSSNASVTSSIRSGSSAGSHPSRWTGTTGIVCMESYEPNLFSTMKGCSRCFSLASEKDQKAFLTKGTIYSIQVTKGGCASACPYIVCQSEPDGVPLCRQCFSSLHNNPQMEKRKMDIHSRARSPSPSRIQVFN